MAQSAIEHVIVEEKNDLSKIGPPRSSETTDSHDTPNFAYRVAKPDLGAESEYEEDGALYRPDTVYQDGGEFVSVRRFIAPDDKKVCVYKPSDRILENNDAEKILERVDTREEIATRMRVWEKIHQHTPKFFSTEPKGSYRMVVPFIQGEKLSKLFLDEEKFYDVVLSIIDCIGHFHAKKEIIIDIAANNFLYDWSTKETHLIDFGCCRELGEPLPHGYNVAEYNFLESKQKHSRVPPEAWNVILFTPEEDEDLTKAYEKIFSTAPEHLQTHKKASYSMDIYALGHMLKYLWEHRVKCKRLPYFIPLCLMTDPTLRPTLDDLKKMVTTVRENYHAVLKSIETISNFSIDYDKPMDSVLKQIQDFEILYLAEKEHITTKILEGLIIAAEWKDLMTIKRLEIDALQDAVQRYHQLQLMPINFSKADSIAAIVEQENYYLAVLDYIFVGKENGLDIKNKVQLLSNIQTAKKSRVDEIEQTSELSNTVCAM